MYIYIYIHSLCNYMRAQTAIWMSLVGVGNISGAKRLAHNHLAIFKGHGGLGVGECETCLNGPMEWDCSWSTRWPVKGMPGAAEKLGSQAWSPNSKTKNI